MMIDVEFSLHPFKIHCTALKVRATVAPLGGSDPDPGSATPTAIPAGDLTVPVRGNTGNTGSAIGNTTGNEAAPGSVSLGNTVRDLGKTNIMTMAVGVGNTNTVQGNILVPEGKKLGNHPVPNAPAGMIWKGDQVDGKWHRKRKENDQDTEEKKMSKSSLSAFSFFRPLLYFLSFSFKLS